MAEESLSPSPWSTKATYRLLEPSDKMASEAEDEVRPNCQQTYIGHTLFHPGTNIVILLMIFITNLVLLSLSIIPQGSTSHISTHTGDSEGIVHTSFSQDRALQSLDHAYDDMWESLSLNKTTAGLIRTSDNGVHTGKGAIAMFHQLHCLTMLRAALQSSTEGKRIGVDWHDDAHWPHCMDYLVKTILCFADDTIERPLRKLDGGEFIDGSNAVRECRSAQPLYSLYLQDGL